MNNDNIPQVSIILPIFNAQKTLKKSVKSALAQTATIELICIDDGSTDSTSNILNKLAKNHPQIRIIRQEHQGPGIARNTGIEQANGKYIAFLDADDILPNRNSLETLIGFAESNKLNVCGGLRTLKARRIIGYSETNLKDSKEHPNGGIIDYSNTQIDYDFANFVYNREFLLTNNITFPNYARYQDVPFLVNALHTAGKYGVHPIECYRYSLHYKHPVLFDKTNTEGLLKGILDVLELSEQYNYLVLKHRTLKRLDEEYLPRIPKDVLNKFSDLCDRIESYRGN